MSQLLLILTVWITMIYRTAEKPLRNFGGLCDCANIQYKLSEMFHLLTIVELREPKVSDYESVKVLVMAD